MKNTLLTALLPLLLCLIVSACSTSNSESEPASETVDETPSSDGTSDDNSEGSGDSQQDDATPPGQSVIPDWSALPLDERAEKTLALLEELMQDAKEKQLDVTREETLVWFANEFLKYADWDEANPDQVEKFFTNFYPYRNRGKEFSDMLPEFERQQVVNILESGILNLSQVIDGTIVRPAVNKIDWENIEVEQDQFVSNGKPIFLFDYFSKSMGNETSNEALYNDHLGNVDHMPSINLQWMGTEEKLAAWQTSKMTSKPSTKVGYALYWNRSIPKWLREKEPNLTQGRSLFTEFDIDNPSAIDAWGKIARASTELARSHKSTQMGIILSNEPHWYSEQGHWTQNYGEMTEISVHTQSKFKTWLREKYEDNITALNQNWQTQFVSFDSVSFEFPIAPSNRGNAHWYDWCRFNMDRATEWFTYLQGEIHDVDPSADTHIKIMPDVFTENNRSHGIDLEALTSLTTMIGDDAKTRGRDLRSNSPEHWESYYAYFWEELAVSYDFMESISPNKIHVNSETHFLSTSWWRDLGTTPQYVRSSIWLATVLGMDAGLHWFWARDPDGSPEQRLEGELNFYDPALAGSYAASAGMQPQVANEVAQVTMDLNSVSEQVMAIRQQRRPIRLFYSETSAINKTQHMTEQFELFESLFFEGLPMGYATKKVIENQNNQDWDMILVYRTEFVTDDEFEALQSYLDQGGTVIVDSLNSLAKDEYGKNRQRQLLASTGNLIVMEQGSSYSDMAKAALEQLPASSNELSLIESNDLDKNTTMWRSVKQDNGHYLVTMMNLGKNTSTLSLTANDISALSVTNLLTGQDLTSTFTLESNGVLMLEVRPI